MRAVATIYHLAFLGCLPVAVLLVATGQWGWGLGVLLFGTPLFWTLRNRAAVHHAVREARGPFKVRGRASTDGFLDDNHPMVKAWGEPGERFLPPVGVIDWNEYLKTIDQPDRIQSVADATRQLVVTNRRIFVVWNDRPMKGSIRLSDVVNVRTMVPPGSPYPGRELALEVQANTPEGRLLAIWSMPREQAITLESKLNSFRLTAA